jgi:hypothetical protein
MSPLQVPRRAAMKKDTHSRAYLNISQRLQHIKSSDKTKCHLSLKVHGKEASLSPTTGPLCRKIPVTRTFFTHTKFPTKEFLSPGSLAELPMREAFFPEPSLICLSRSQVKYPFCRFLIRNSVERNAPF